MTTIICVDDDPEHGENIASILKEPGYKVLLAGNNEECLEMILEHSPNLILYNIDTSPETRYQILKTVRENYPLLADMPFIFISDASDKEQILMDLKAGADAFATKPINKTLLLATVKASLRQVRRIKYKHDRLLVLDI